MKGRYLPWLILGIFCFAASLGKPPYEEFIPVPPLASPLEQMRDLGRPISLGLLACLLYFTGKTSQRFSPKSVPKSLQYLWLVQLVVALKNMIYGDAELAIILLVAYTLFIYVMVNGVAKWIRRDGFDSANSCLIIAIAIFSIANLYQVAQNSYPLAVLNGQFNGTSNNPQMAALTLISAVPCLMFQIEKKSSVFWEKVLYPVLLIVVLYFLWWTASRTGLIMAIATIVFFYRTRQGALLRVVGVMLTLLFVAVLFIQPDNFAGIGANDVGLSMASKLQEGTNTRTEAWTALLNAFLDNPIFGAPLESDRLGFGESSWLAAGATVGMLGMLPLLMFGFECLKSISAMLKISRKMPAYYFHCSVVVSGIAGLLVGSIAEAF